MTDVSTEPVVAPAAAPPEKPPPTGTSPTTTPAPTAEAGVRHTAGGWPVVPLAVTGVNSTVSVVAASALAGGPVGVAVAAAGAAAIGTAAAVRHRRKIRTKTRRTHHSAGIGKSGGHRGFGGLRNGGIGRGGSSRRSVPSQGRATASRSTGAASRPLSGAKGAKPSLGKGGSSGRQGGASAGGASAGGRVGHVRGLRDAARRQSPTRHAARTGTAQARRSVADARRGAHAAGTTGRGRAGLISRAGKAAAGKARALRDAAVRKARAGRDARTARRLESSRDRIRKARVRKAARQALRRSALRKQGRRVLAALLAGPLGVLGMLTTPLGRKLGWAWLQHPGRRFYRHMMRTAEERKAHRDAAIRERLAAEEKALDDASGDAPEIGDTAQRPAHLLPAQPDTTPVEVVSMSGFRFEEAAAEMENAARNYEPENSMEILSMVENLPYALTSVANTFRILAERSDSEFPLEKDIAGAFDEIYGALMRAVDTSADLGQLFRQVHAHDIARHEDPRNGPQAEKGWNV
ncbi:hypothetical protein OG892_12865 [Streptomyces sp. NBC_00341]|uniref:hypothetical protein n=1 Tax=Streptomyces sp. NBC_00341 TaxID=2975717 RepID=UPI00308FDBCF|nr:hypothetical protein OG892_12865 [Streptomyces sp. NBC_00341]